MMLACFLQLPPGHRVERNTVFGALLHRSLLRIARCHDVHVRLRRLASEVAEHGAYIRLEQVRWLKQARLQNDEEVAEPGRRGEIRSAECRCQKAVRHPGKGGAKEIDHAGEPGSFVAVGQAAQWQ